MKTLTNFTGGPRGVNMEGGTTVWIEPGESADIDEAKVVGDVPDMGTAPTDDTPPSDTPKMADLKKQVASLTADLAAKDAQLAKVTADLADAKPKA